MKERVFTFGADQVLMGVLTEPAADVARADAPVVIVSNVGLNARIGPHRLWVSLARSLARAGFTTLRFDVNGLGDSLPRRDARSDLERAVTDHLEAMDFLQKKRGASRFVIIGMCSGVDSAHRVAVADPRIVGAVFLDGYVYETQRSKLRWKVGRHFTLDGLLRNVRRRLPRLGPPRAEAPSVFVREYPTPEQFSADLETMLARDTRLAFLFTGGLWMWFNYEEQFFEMLRPARFEGRVDVELRKQADHTFMIPSEREWLVTRLTEWIGKQRFSGPAARG
ncbi:MAG: hypothetical protein ACOZQL_22085 [Myxococcota bacterium]